MGKIKKFRRGQGVSFRETIHALNRRYRLEWERAQKLQAELENIQQSRAWKILTWWRKWAKSFRSPIPAPPFEPHKQIEILKDFPQTGEGSVSIIIPFKNHLELLRNCLKSLKGSFPPPGETVLVDNGSTCPRMKKFLSRLAFQTGHKILSCPGPFNFSKLCNEGAKAAGSQYLLFLNNDVEILDNDWLGKMLAVAQHPKVAIVGATLLYSDYTLQHAGIFPQGDGTWQHAYRFQPADFAGYAGELRHVRIVPAVTGACFMIEKDLFNRLGGFNEELPVTHNDVDLCLRFNALGLKSAITPHARLFHFESISRGFFNKSFASNFE